LIGGRIIHDTRRDSAPSTNDVVLLLLAARDILQLVVAWRMGRGRRASRQSL